MAVEAGDLLGIEGRAACEQAADGVLGARLQRQDEQQLPRGLRTELQRGEPLCDLADEAGLGHRRDRKRNVADALQDDRGAAVDALRRAPADVDAGETSV